MKVFKLGILVGRFQPIHKGHQKLINIGLSLCDKLIIFISSAQESSSKRNPFDYELRLELIKAVLKSKLDSGRIEVYGLNDLTNENDLIPEWGEYVLDNVKKHTNKFPNCIIYGKDNEDNIRKCFTVKATEKITEIFVDRKSDNISATMIRQLILQDKKQEFKKYVDHKIYNRYDELKKILNNIYKK